MPLTNLLETPSLPFPHLDHPWRGLRAEQQPAWEEHPELPQVRRWLAESPPLVRAEEADALRRALARVAVGDALLLQAGDCAESFYECSLPASVEKVETLERLTNRLRRVSGQHVVSIGRFGGQFAKPRSNPTEQHAGAEIPVFRGHMVNSEMPVTAARQPDPLRLLWAYQASSRVLDVARSARERASGEPGPAADGFGPWASHEALVLDYESSLVRREGVTGAAYLTSTHLPWIGDRTRQPGFAHVQMLASVHNPVACKVGPTTDPRTLVQLCRILDPDRAPGRLTLIVRMGHAEVAEVLPELVRAVRNAGHPVIWLCDPMHGNTVRTADGLKTRHLSRIGDEADACRRLLSRQGEHPAGLHLEVAAAEVTECVGGPVTGADQVAGTYTTLCDPRLNPAQAEELIERWAQDR
ncbi:MULTISPECIES: 3-deoxy-7-phosphoheptulonate synthase [unclassified Streptomyces]|uniref:3-deoxy-7-phosphoheptulonate synthase n=1 Tax=unclassified Streptomyces TaxID=2593676 RepID=UPI00039F9CA2|nr:MULTISPECIES: 3-deoxy-7-phosphoheptulonate synthase [unclassified Streptomyces]MYT33073.1 phospho-2-dehydro-3-deoxyheptonate aldolase [Streptomyces sp. SID8354]